ARPVRRNASVHAARSNCRYTLSKAVRSPPFNRAMVSGSTCCWKLECASTTQGCTRKGKGRSLLFPSPEGRGEGRAGVPRLAPVRKKGGRVGRVCRGRGKRSFRPFSFVRLSAVSANCPRTLFPTSRFLQTSELADEIRLAPLASHLLQQGRGRIGETLRQEREKHEHSRHIRPGPRHREEAGDLRRHRPGGADPAGLAGARRTAAVLGGVIGECLAPADRDGGTW